MSDGTPADKPADSPVRLSYPRRAMRFCKRVGKVIGGILLLYVLIVFVGLIPVNNDFRPAADGVTITVTSNLVHADIIVPIETDEIDWREHFPAEFFKGDTSRATHIAFGWGDKGFYLETPSWADLKASTAVKALLLPSASCMHVTMMTEKNFAPDAQSVSISHEQYRQLVAFLQSGFRVDEQNDVIAIKNFAYGQNDAFFEANGSYNAVNSCNAWAGRGLKHAGVRVGWLTPVPKTVGLYLPE